MAFIRRGYASLTGDTRANRVLQAAATQPTEPTSPPPPPPSPTYNPPNVAAAPASGGQAGLSLPSNISQNIFTGPQGLVSRPRTSRRSLLGDG